MSHAIIEPGDEQQVSHGDEAAAAHLQITALLPAGDCCGHSVVLPDGRSLTLLVQEAADAEALAAAPRTSGGDLYAADAKPVARAVADALVAAGLGGS